MNKPTNIRVKGEGFTYLYEEIPHEGDERYRDTKHALRIMTTIAYQLGVHVPNWIMAQSGMYSDDRFGGE